MKSFMFKKPISRIMLPILAIFMLAFAINTVTQKDIAQAAMPTVPPASSKFAQTVAGVGIIEPKSELISVGTFMPGVVMEVYRKVGEDVKKGDLLFALDDRDTKAELNKAEAVLASAQIQAADLKQELSLYENISDKRAISSDELERKRYASKLANAKVAEAQAMIDSIKTNLERLTVTAPIDGKILRVNVRPGEYAQAGVLKDPLMIIGDVSTMHVRVEVDETDALRVKPAAEVYGTLRGSTTEQIGLKFVRKEPLLSPKKTLTGDGNERVDTRVQQLIYSFDNAKAGAFVGQQMDVFIDAK